LIGVLNDRKKFIGFLCLFCIVIFCTSAPATGLTRGSTASKLLPNLQFMVGDDTHPKYEFQYFVSLPMKQNSTNDVKLVGTVTQVIDGDTLDINGIRIRLSLVDTPERGQSGYNEAKRFVETLCLGKKGELDVDNGQRRGDRYGREIGVVYCDGSNVNEKIMSNHMARILTEFCDISEFSNESWAKPQC